MSDYRLKLFRGAWCVVWNHDGKTRRASLRTKDRAEADRRFADFLKSLAIPEGTVAEIYAAYEREKAGNASIQRIADAWKALAPTFANLRPDQVTKLLCMSYAKARANAGRAPGTVAKELSCLRAALRWHDRNTPAIIALPPAPAPRDRHLTREEYEALVSACVTPHIRLFVILALATAARSKALLELTWDRVDFARGRIDLRSPGVARRKGRAVVPMTNRARQALEEAHRARTCEHVIEYAGAPVERIVKGFRAAVDRAGLEGVSPHVLRHTAAVWMAESGISMAKIAQYLGHEDSRITERVYARFAPDHFADAAAALEA